MGTQSPNNGQNPAGRYYYVSRYLPVVSNRRNEEIFNQRSGCYSNNQSSALNKCIAALRHRTEVGSASETCMCVGVWDSEGIAVGTLQIPTQAVQTVKWIISHAPARFTVETSSFYCVYSSSFNIRAFMVLASRAFGCLFGHPNPSKEPLRTPKFVCMEFLKISISRL